MRALPRAAPPSTYCVDLRFPLSSAPPSPFAASTGSGDLVVTNSDAKLGYPDGSAGSFSGDFGPVSGGSPATVSPARACWKTA